MKRFEPVRNARCCYPIEAVTVFGWPAAVAAHSRMR